MQAHRSLRTNGNRVGHHDLRGFCRQTIRLARSVVNDGLTARHFNRGTWHPKLANRRILFAAWSPAQTLMIAESINRRIMREPADIPVDFGPPCSASIGLAIIVPCGT